MLQDVNTMDSHLRVITFHDTLDSGQPIAIQLARPLSGVDSVLSHLRLILTLLFLGGIALAAVLGRMASRRVLRPLGEVAEAAQHIGETEDLHSRLHVHADDEVGQLATNFNAMLDRLETSRDALDDSVRAQRQLVADASHELRTPVTSLRTNIEVLLEGGELDPEDRRRLLADVVEQSEELSALVNDLIELARGDQPGPDTDDVRLDRVAADSLARARRNAPGINFNAQLEPVLVDGVPERLGRAMNNLLDNAARHRPPGGAVEFRVDRERRARPRSRRGRRRGRPSLRVRPLLPRDQLPGTSGERPGPRDRAPGDRAARRHGVGGQRSPTAARSSRWRCRRRRATWRRTRPAVRRIPSGPAAPGRSGSAERNAAPRAASHPRLASDHELPAQQPEEDREHGNDDHQQESPLLGLAEDRHHPDLDHHRRDARQQRGMRPVAREVLAGGDLAHTECAHHEPDDERRPAAVEKAEHRADDAEEDRHLGDRQASERTLRALALAPELAPSAPALAHSLGGADRALVAPAGCNSTRGPIGRAALARAFGLLRGQRR